MADSKDTKAEATEQREDPDAARRAALAKIGRFAGYTAPVMLGLLGATKARAQSAGSPVTCPA